MLTRPSPSGRRGLLARSRLEALGDGRSEAHVGAIVRQGRGAGATTATTGSGQIGIELPSGVRLTVDAAIDADT